MRIITFALAGALVFWAANSALAAKRTVQKSDTTVQKTEQETTNPHAPAQQRFRRERHKKTSHH